MPTPRPQRQIWVCTKCGTHQDRPATGGRPQPGTCLKNNGKEHKWVKDRKY